MLGVVGARLRREVGEAPTLLDSRPASEEGSWMDPARFPHAPHRLAPDSQNTCARIDPVMERRRFIEVIAGALLAAPLAAAAQEYKAGKVPRIGWLLSGSLESLEIRA